MTSLMSVSLLKHSYLNEKYEKVGLTPKATDIRYFQPLLLTNTGTTFANTLRKCLMEEVESYAIKNSLSMETYEQVDSTGTDYLDPQKYGAMYALDQQVYHFGGEDTDRTKKREYMNSSGYAKVTENTTSEHNQVITERMGLIPVNSNLSFVLVDNEDSGEKIRIPLDQIWIVVGKFGEDSARVAPVVNNGKAKMAVTLFEHMNVYYNENGKWIDITRSCVPESTSGADLFKNVDSGFLFPCNSFITYLKTKQKFGCRMRLDFGKAKKYAKWTSALVRYKYATTDDLDPGSQTLSSFGVNDRQRHYIVNPDPVYRLVFSNEPESIVLSLESIYKLNCNNAMYRALGCIQKHLHIFRNDLLECLAVGDKRDTKISVENFEYPTLSLKIKKIYEGYADLIVDQIIRFVVGLAASGKWKAEYLESAAGVDHKEYIEETFDEGNTALKSLRENSDLKTKHETRSQVSQHGSIQDHFASINDVAFESTLDDQKSTVQRWLTDMKVAYMRKHPLRPEIFISVKLPTELFANVGTDQLDEYFLKSHYEKNWQLYQMMWIILKSLDDLNTKIENIKFEWIKLVDAAILSGQKNSWLRQMYDHEHQGLMVHPLVPSPFYDPQHKKDHDHGPGNFSLKEQVLYDGVAVCKDRSRFLSDLYFLSQNIGTNSNTVVVYMTDSTASEHILLKRYFPHQKFLVFNSKFPKIYTDRKTVKPNIFEMDDDSYIFYETAADAKSKFVNDFTGAGDDVTHFIFGFDVDARAGHDGVIGSLISSKENLKILLISNRTMEMPATGAQLSRAQENVLVWKFQTKMQEHNAYHLQVIGKLRNSIEHCMIRYYLSSTRAHGDQFYAGTLWIPPYGSRDDTFLLITKEELSKPLINYQASEYNAYYAYMTNIVRRSMAFTLPLLTFYRHPMYFLNYKFDHLSELRILSMYVNKFDTNNPDYMNVMWNMLVDIESFETMSNIDWNHWDQFSHLSALKSDVLLPKSTEYLI